MVHRKGNLQHTVSRREFLGLSGGLVAASLLAACGASPTTVTGMTTDEAAPASQGPAFKGELEVWDWEYPVRETVVKELTQTWMADHPDIPIKYLALPWADIETKILAVGTAGNAPPISGVYYGWRYDLQRAGVISPYPDDFVPNRDDLISTAFVRDENGKTRAFPSGWFVDMIYFNKDIFEKEGLTRDDIPTKWDDFLKLADQLTVRDANGVVQRAGCGMNDYWQHEYLWQDLIYQQGGWLYNADGTEALWLEEPSVNSLQFIQDWYFKHKIDSRDLPEGYGSFCNDLAAMFIGSGWNHGFFMADFPQMKDRWDTAVLPTFSGTASPSYGVGSPEENFQVFSSHPQDVQQAAFAYIKHLMVGKDRAMKWAQAQGCAPDVKALLNDPDITAIPGVRDQASTMEHRVCFGERPIEAEKYWRTMFDKVTLEKGDVREALDEATKPMNVELPKKKRYFTERNYNPPT